MLMDTFIMWGESYVEAKYFLSSHLIVLLTVAFFNSSNLQLETLFLVTHDDVIIIR